MNYRGTNKKTLYHGNGKPRERYRNQVKIAGWHNTTLTGDSVSFADTYNDTADVVLTGNTIGLDDAVGNIKSNGIIAGAFPALRKAKAVGDELICKTGVRTKRISDWLNLTGNLTYSIWTSLYPNTIMVTLPTGMIATVTGGYVGYKYDGTKLINSGTNSLADHIEVSATGVIYLGIPRLDAGYGGAYIPTNSEAKAYFYGWKMCNADGSSPYYKSEIPYTPSTWAEWTKSAGITGDSTGLILTSDGSGVWLQAYISTSLLPSKKYGFLYNVVSANTPLYLGGTSVYPFSQNNLTNTVGNNKAVVTSNTTISTNKVILQISKSVLNEAIKLKDFRIYELPVGSQIEADFNTLTADQLAIKYPFQGLCTKNWKHVTDGLGQTAVLPTVSYDGYTPYKMLYQLATPVVTQETPIIVPTHYPSTVIETDSTVKPTISATVKVPD